MKKIKIIVNGLPGNMATEVAKAILGSTMELLPVSLTGPEVTQKSVVIDGFTIFLVSPENKELLISESRPDIIIDFTVPTAIKNNITFYTENEIPFVLGTTGGDLDFITKKVIESGIVAVVAPNMAKEIVAFQAMIEYAAKSFPGAFKGYQLEVVESHQKNKADTSGTAKAIIASFNQLGVPFTVSQIDKKRQESDYEAMGIPREHWDGHGWHTYTLKKPDGSVFFQFTHNVNGRGAYVAGVLEAVNFLQTVTELPFRYCGVYSMRNVLMKAFD